DARRAPAHLFERLRHSLSPHRPRAKRERHPPLHACAPEPRASPWGLGAYEILAHFRGDLAAVAHPRRRRGRAQGRNVKVSPLSADLSSEGAPSCTRLSLFRSSSAWWPRLLAERSWLARRVIPPTASPRPSSAAPHFGPCARSSRDASRTLRALSSSFARPPWVGCGSARSPCSFTS